MKLKEARQKRNDFRFIIGTTLGEEFVEDIAIIPKSSNVGGQIYSRLNMGMDYKDLLSGYDDFDLVVIYDYNNLRLGGFLMTDNLDKVIKQFNLTANGRKK
ncbi:hypothetical protein [Pedobacter chitinilyticus]|uniref:Uncharacterized protein n=1 Tax=Pedobacter chitinilyticus TaxID=2233776 RepID=A0A443Z274_9SPHI|nr:hypothetical protein [Pedobacter chitinilyticus]RWU10637.1 hypothetical protein DPV69_04675 [Pedobacter chitinilyticus]